VGHRWLREHGVAVPRKETRNAKGYVRSKIRRAIKSGVKTIDTAAARYAGMKVSSTRSRKVACWREPDTTSVALVSSIWLPVRRGK
jgi:hypothetical protein